MQTFEETIAAPPDDVWGFIVDPAALSVWFGADAWLDPAEGGAVRFRFGDGTQRRGTGDHQLPDVVHVHEGSATTGTGHGDACRALARSGRSGQEERMHAPSLSQ